MVRRPLVFQLVLLAPGARLARWLPGFLRCREFPGTLLIQSVQLARRHPYRLLDLVPRQFRLSQAVLLARWHRDPLVPLPDLPDLSNLLLQASQLALSDLSVRVHPGAQAVLVGLLYRRRQPCCRYPRRS